MDNISVSYFLRVCDLHNFTRAAESLHISQPALSRRIIALEDEIGVKLLDRTNGGVRLTDGGKLFYENAKELINVESSLKEKMERYRGGFYGKIRVGYKSHGYIKPLIFAVQMMKQTYPEIEIELREMAPQYILYSYLQGEIDIVYTFGEDFPQNDDSISEMIIKNNLVILIPRGHRLWDNDSVASSDLLQERFVTTKAKSVLSRAYWKEFEKNGVVFDNVLQCESMTARLFRIAFDGYIGIDGSCSAEYLNDFSDYIRPIPCSDIKVNFADYYAAYHPSNSNAVRFVNFLAIFEESIS